MSDDNFALFVWRRMGLVIKNAAQRVTKHGTSFFETDFVSSLIDFRFLNIPLKPYTHLDLPISLCCYTLPKMKTSEKSLVYILDCRPTISISRRADCVESSFASKHAPKRVSPPPARATGAVGLMQC